MMIINALEWLLTPGVDQAFYAVLGGLLALFLVVEIRANGRAGHGKEGES